MTGLRSNTPPPSSKMSSEEKSLVFLQRGRRLKCTTRLARVDGSRG